MSKEKIKGSKMMIDFLNSKAEKDYFKGLLTIQTPPS